MAIHDLSMTAGGAWLLTDVEGEVFIAAGTVYKRPRSAGRVGMR
jgi:hypothetical protein